MHLDEGVEEALGLGPVLGQVDEELVEAAEVLTPLEEIGAEAGHDGVVGGLMEMAGLGPDVGQVLGREGLVEGRRGQGRPGDPGHELGQAGEQGRVAVPFEEREVPLAEVEGAGGHLADERAVGGVDDPAALVGLEVRVGREKRGRAVGERPGRPIRGVGEPSPAEVDDVGAGEIEDGRLGQGQLLDDVVDADGVLVQAEVPFERGVGHGRDAGRAHAAEIDGDAVGLAVGDGGEHAFAAGHGRSSSIMRTGAARPSFPMRRVLISNGANAKGTCTGGTALLGSPEPRGACPPSSPLPPPPAAPPSFSSPRPPAA